MIIFRKTFLALTGLFICIFLVAHLCANFLLLLPEENARQMYNAYSAALRGNIFITVVAYINYGCIIFHVLYALIITRKNYSARSIRYEVNHYEQNSTWTSQNMLFLGLLILFFIVVHMSNFWYKVKFQHEDNDLYQMVVDLFHQPVYTLLYVLAAFPLGLHLAHGVQSAFKTLGLYHKKYLRWVAKFSVYYAFVTGIGFAIIPIVLYFR